MSSPLDAIFSVLFRFKGLVEPSGFYFLFYFFYLFIYRTHSGRFFFLSFVFGMNLLKRLC